MCFLSKCSGPAWSWVGVLLVQPSCNRGPLARAPHLAESRGPAQGNSAERRPGKDLKGSPYCPPCTRGSDPIGSAPSPLRVRVSLALGVPGSHFHLGQRSGLTLQPESSRGSCRAPALTLTPSGGGCRPGSPSDGLSRPQRPRNVQ